MFSKEVLEGIKQFIRVILLSLIPLLIAQLQMTGGFDWKTFAVTAAIAVLSGIDKWLHKKDVETPLDLKSFDILEK